MDRSYKQINVYKYEGNIQVDMQDKEYKVSSNKSSGEFRVDVTLSILDKVLNEDDLNDKPYYMFVNNTGEIFESRISNGKATFCYNPAETNSNQKVLFSFNREDFACKKSANSKSLDFMLINKTDRENKKAERTFNINKGDIETPFKFKDLPDKKTVEGTAFLDELEYDEIIRIEAEDGSEEYIEIIFPKDNKDWKDTVIDIGKAAGEYALDRITDLATIKKGGRLGRLGKIANFTDNAKKVLTKKDVLDVIKNKYGLKKEKIGSYGKNAYIARDNNQIKEIWEDISKDAKEIENKIDSFDHPIIRRELDDGTEIQLRKQSGSGGSTIEIDKSKTKIHNEAGEIGDW